MCNFLQLLSFNLQKFTMCIRNITPTFSKVILLQSFTLCFFGILRGPLLRLQESPLPSLSFLYLETMSSFYRSHGKDSIELRTSDKPLSNIVD